VGDAVGDGVGDAEGLGVGDGVGDGVGTTTHAVSAIAPAVHCAAAQAAQFEEPAESWYLPDGQRRHAVCCGPAVYSPALQAAHASPLALWYLPAGQSEHAVAGDTAYWPLSHTAHSSAL
jgi:hypothetical protein